MLLEGKSQNLLPNASFEAEAPLPQTAGVSMRREQGSGLHGDWDLTVEGQARLWLAPVELRTVAPWNEYYLTCYVRRADGKALQSGEVMAFAAADLAGENLLKESHPAVFGDQGWTRVGGWFGAIGKSGSKFTCGFAFGGKSKYSLDCIQLEPVSRWPRGASSFIPTEETPATRAGDSLTIPTRDVFRTNGGAITLWTANREDSPGGLLFHVGAQGIVQFSAGGFGVGNAGGDGVKPMDTGWRQVALVWNGKQANFFRDGYADHSGHGAMDYELPAELEPTSFLAHPNTISAFGLIADFMVWDRPLKDWEIKHLASTGKVEGAKPPADTALHVPVRFVTSREGKVTVGLYDKAGLLCRQLLVGSARPAGPQTVDWDGRDDQGQPLPIGAYEARVAVSNIRGIFDGKVGNNSPSPGDDGLQYRSGEYVDVEALSDGSCLTLSYSGEGARLLQRINADGSVAWSCTRCDPGPGLLYALATDGGWVYTVTSVLNEKDPRSGQWLIREAIVRWNIKTGAFAVFPFSTTLPVNKARPADLPVEEQTDAAQRRSPFPGLGVRGLDAAGGKLFVPLYYENRIAVFDAEQGKEVQTIAVPDPVGICGAKTGALYVISGKSVRKFSLDGKESGTAAAGLEAPWGVDVAGNGDLYVTDLGASQQIKVFDKDGKLKKTFGRQGGFEWGRPAPDKFAYPLGVSVGPDGAVYVADYGNQRVLVFNARWKVKQTLLSRHFWRSCFNPFDPSVVYDYFGGWWLAEYRVDYRKKTWSLSRKWPMGESSIGLRNDSGPVLFRKLGGKVYAIAPAGNPLVFEMDGDRLLPRVMLGTDDYPITENGKVVQHKHKGAWEWRDENMDGGYQEAEYVKGGWTTVHGYHDSWADDAGNLYLGSHTGSIVLKVPLKGIDQKGLPLYHWADASVAVDAQGAISIMGVITDPKGNLYLTDTPGYADYAVRPNVRVLKYAPDGKQLWAAGRKQKGFKKPGMLNLPTDFAGWLDGYLFVGDTDGTIEVFTDDGLWVGRLGDDLPEQYLNMGETFGHCVFRHPETGKVYAYVAPDCTFRMTRMVVEGLDRVERLRATVNLTQMASGIKLETDGGPPPMRILQRAGPVDIDGVIGPIEWGLTQPSLNAPANLPEEGEIQATCWAQWDDEALYLAFKVQDATPAVNKQLDDMRWAADQVEFMICTDSTQHAWHSAHTTRDFQLELGPDANGRVDAWIILSGGLKNAFVPDAKVALKVQPGQGYTLEARLPWKSLGGFKPAKGAEVAWNFVVCWGTPDGAGQMRSLKWRSGLHYMPQNWGKAVLE